MNMNYMSTQLRKLIRNFLLWIIILLPVCSFAASNRTEVREMIYQYCESELGYSRDELSFNNLSKRKNGSWDFSLCVMHPEELTDGSIRGLINQDGTMDHVDKPSPVSVSDWLSREVNRCLFSYRDIYDLSQRWASRLDSIPEEDIEEFDFMHDFNPIPELLRMNIILPDERCIPYDEALRKSIDYMEEMDGWTPEKVSHLGLHGEIVYIPQGTDHPIYRFIYSPASIAVFDRIVAMNEEYDNAMEKKVDRMEKEEDAVFGKDTPLYISVRIDAYSGNLIDKIYVHTIAQEDTWLPLTCTGMIVWK